MKNIEGVYRVEILGPYGWESFATSFIHDGRYRAASKNHFTQGTYEVDGQNLTMKLRITQHGEPRTIFGKKGEKGVMLEFEGTIKKSEILGRTNPVGESAHTVTFRYIRLSDIDET